MQQDHTPPVWSSKSNAPAMDVLGTIYEHLLHTGQHQLAGELYAVRNTIDYAFLPAAEADSGDNENVYVAKHSNKRWKTDHPPPRNCLNCGGRHWRSDCPVQKQKQENSAAKSFPRGKPPARVYISRQGKCFDTTRRPTSECQKCEKLH